eukprot:scaffold80876_cov75-Phaeocystis_antarctica.AAC.3
MPSQMRPSSSTADEVASLFALSWLVRVGITSCVQKESCQRDRLRSALRPPLRSLHPPRKCSVSTASCQGKSLISGGASAPIARSAAPLVAWTTTMCSKSRCLYTSRLVGANAAITSSAAQRTSDG